MFYYIRFCQERSGNILRKISVCRSLIKLKFSTDQVRPALGSVGCWLIGCDHPQKTSKLPYYRLFRPDIQILSALTALYWPSTAFYWPSTTKYQPVPPYTDPVPSCINQYRLLQTQYHQVPNSTALYWPSTTTHYYFKFNFPLSAWDEHSCTLVPTYTDPVPPSTNQYRPPLTQYSMIWRFRPCKPNIFWKHITLATSTALFLSSITKYRPVPPYTDPVPPRNNQCRPLPTKYNQVPISTA